MRIESTPPKDDPAHETDYGEVFEVINTRMDSQSRPGRYCNQSYRSTPPSREQEATEKYGRQQHNSNGA